MKEVTLHCLSSDIIKGLSHIMGQRWHTFVNKLYVNYLTRLKRTIKYSKRIVICKVNFIIGAGVPGVSSYHCTYH